MDDLQYGTRNKRGDWAPNDKAEVAPIWNFPPTPLKVLKWLPSYFLPYDVLWIASAFAWWHFVLPDAETMKTVSWSWVLPLYFINLAAVFIFYGLFELRLYISRAQGTRFKYNGKWPADNKSDVFWFKSQNIDSVLRIIFTSVPVWTALEVGILYCFANGLVPWMTWSEHATYLLIIALLVPIIHETHFFCIHWLIHIPSLYKWVHSVHHNSVNPSPISSLNMHVVELALYFGMACWMLVIPSHPILAIYMLHRAGFGAIVGHIGFDKMEVGENHGVATHAYIHYLHHKYFEVNYGDGLIPFDKWFGYFHDGSAESQKRFDARYEKLKAKMNPPKRA